METIVNVVWIVCAIVFLGALWGLRCNEKAFDQRIALLPDAGDPDFYEKMVRYKSVSYRRHFWHLFMFRDPYKLYEN